MTEELKSLSYKFASLLSEKDEKFVFLIASKEAFNSDSLIFCTPEYSKLAKELQNTLNLLLKEKEEVV